MNRNRFQAIDDRGRIGRIGWGWILFFLALAIGCGTTTRRIGTEQLLISDAVDTAIDQIDFSSLRGVNVYLDSRYISTLKTNNFVDSNYVISSLRQQLTAAGAKVQDDREQAKLVIEPRVGALGTDGHDVTYGIPQSNALSSAVNVLSSSTVPVIPEIALAHTDAQSGIAKLVVFAYDRESRDPVWQSGLAKAESTSRNTWVLGAGPFQKGTIYDGVRFAGHKLEPPVMADDAFGESGEPFIPENLHFDQAFIFDSVGEDIESEEEADDEIQQANFESETKAAEVKAAKSKPAK